jgi:hypothetical protein
VHIKYDRRAMGLSPEELARQINERRRLRVSSQVGLESTKTPSEGLPLAPAVPQSRRLRAVDWTALGLFALTGIWAFAAYASTVASRNGSIPSVLASDLGSILWLPALSGLGAGMVALLDSKGRPKWPGIVALFSPLLGVLGGVMSFVAAWSGLP